MKSKNKQRKQERHEAELHEKLVKALKRENQWRRMAKENQKWQRDYFLELLLFFILIALVGYLCYIIG